MSTKIEWCDETWNPITGCTPIGDGCTHCYAMKMFDRNLWDYGREPTFHPKRLDQPLRWKQKECEDCERGRILSSNEAGDEYLMKCLQCNGAGLRPLRIFVNSMGDLFHEDVPQRWRSDVFRVIADHPQHTFIILTKRPKAMNSFAIFAAEYFGNGAPLPNLHLYVSAWNQPSLDHNVGYLLDTPAAVRGVSYEPALGPVNFERWLFYNDVEDGAPVPSGKLHHIICGGETGPGARPMHPDWARSVRDQCQAAGVPFFFKQMSKKAQIPSDLMIREMP